MSHSKHSHPYHDLRKEGILSEPTTVRTSAGWLPLSTRFSVYLTIPSVETTGHKQFPLCLTGLSGNLEGPGLVSRVGLTDVTQQSEDGPFPQATAVLKLVQVLQKTGEALSVWSITQP